MEPGDRVLFFTDGITEEHLAGGDLFGERRLIDLLEKVAQEGGPVRRRCDGFPTRSSAPEAKSPMTTPPCSCWNGVAARLTTLLSSAPKWSPSPALTTLVCSKVRAS